MTNELRQSPGHLIRRCLQLHNTLFAEGTAGLGITSPQWAALRALHECPGIEQVKLSELIAYDPSTIGGLVDRLQSKGLVGRSPDAADRRLKRLNLTPAGHRFFEAHRDEVRAVTNRFIAPLTPVELGQLTALLGRLLDRDDVHEITEPVRRSAAS